MIAWVVLEEVYLACEMVEGYLLHKARAHVA